MKITKTQLREIINEVINESKYPFDDIKVGTKIHYDYGIIYVVTKLYPGGFQMSMKSRDKTTRTENRKRVYYHKKRKRYFL